MIDTLPNSFVDITKKKPKVTKSKEHQEFDKKVKEKLDKVLMPNSTSTHTVKPA